MYSFCALAGVIAGVTLLVITLRADKVQADRKALVFVIYGTLIGCIVGAWLMDNIAHCIGGEPFGSGGISANGGIIGAVVVCYFCGAAVFGSRNDARYFLHLTIPAVSLVQAFGRIGCFFAGCCFGVPSRWGIGVSYPEGSKAALLYGAGTKLVPTQLIESVFLFALTAVLLLLVRKRRLVFYLYTYGVYRFIAEFWRGDDRGALVPFLSPSQFTSLLFIVAATIILIVLKNRGDRGMTTPEYLHNTLGKTRKKRKEE